MATAPQPRWNPEYSTGGSRLVWTKKTEEKTFELNMQINT